MNTIKDNIKQSKKNWWKNNPSYWKNWYKQNKAARLKYMRNRYYLSKLPCNTCIISIKQCNNKCPYTPNKYKRKEICNDTRR